MNNNLVFIPSLGIITSVESITSPIIFTYSAKYVYSLVRDESIYNNREMMVKRTLEIDSKALISLGFPNEIYGASISEIRNNIYNNIMRDELENDEDEPKKSKKSNKHYKDKDDENKKLVLSQQVNDLLEDYNLREIVINRDVIEQSPVSITQSRPYQDMAAKHEEVMMTNLAKLGKAIALRSEALQHSRTPDETLGGSVDDLLPELTADVSAINRAGLANYEEKLKQDIENKTNLINNIYEWFETKVINKFNSKSQTIFGILTEEEIKIADVVIKRKEVMDNFFENEFIPINPFNLPRKK